MAGIAFIFPKMKSFWPEEEKGDVREWRFLKWIWTSASLSISCQLTTGPLAWYYFSSFPQHFLLTNLIAIPLTGIIIPAALITLVLNTFGICPLFMLRLTEGLAEVLTSSLAIIATM
jgi:competence protein ComEC